MFLKHSTEFTKQVSPSNISIGRSSEKTGLKDTLKHLYRYGKIHQVK